MGEDERSRSSKGGRLSRYAEMGAGGAVGKQMTYEYILSRSSRGRLRNGKIPVDGLVSSDAFPIFLVFVCLLRRLYTILSGFWK